MKKLSLLLAASVFVSSCSKTIKEIHEGDKVPVEKNTLQSKEDIKSFPLIKKILASDAPNFALAQLLSKTVSPSERKDLEKLISSLSPDEIATIVTQLKKDNNSIAAQYFFHGQKYQNNDLFLKNSLFTKESVSVSLPLEEQLKVSAFTYIKNKALDEILNTYNARVQSLSKELANELAIQIANESPVNAQTIEDMINSQTKVEALENLAKYKPVLEKIDEYFKNSGLNENEQYSVVGSGILVGALYMTVKDNNGFKKILADGSRIYGDLKILNAKVNEFLALANTLNTHFKDAEKNVSNLKEGLQGCKDDFRSMMDDARNATGKSSDIQSKRIMDFLYTKVIKGQDITSENTDPSILSKQVRINANVTKSLKAAGDIANNLSTILATTNSMMAMFHIPVSKDLANIMNKAQKVAAVVSTVQSMTVGFAAGGPIGALAALGSSGIMSGALGGGDNNAAQFKMINAKLDHILENQKKMMEMQIETMKMVKDLALMVDQYHQEEMRALSELRDDVLVNVEISKTLLNKDIRSCERMINYQLSSVWKEIDFKIDSSYGINDLKIINSRFYANINSLGDIRRIVNSVEENGFETCQNGIVEAFGGNSVTENPLRSIFMTSDDKNLFQFQHETYAPLLSLLYSFAGTNLNSIPLHVPSANFVGIKEKNTYVVNAKKEEGDGDQYYDVEQLVSTKGLERYLGQLLVLYPFLEVDKDIWQKELDSIVDTYLNNANSDSNQNIRSYYFLNNALRLVQSAIAQEAILAGEPIIPQLYEKMNTEMFSSETCSKTDLNDVSSCYVKRNKLLMKNFFLYSAKVGSINYGDRFNSDYKNAYTSGNFPALAKLFSVKLTPERFLTKTQNDQKIHYVVFSGELNSKGEAEKIEIRVPTPYEMELGNFIYSENMFHLLQMQKAVIENLQKVAPLKRNDREDNLEKLLVMSK